MIRLFAIEILEREIERLRKEGNEESEILIAQFEREIIILEHVALGNIEVAGKTVEEFRDYMRGRVLILEDEKVFEMDRFEKDFCAFLEEYRSHIKEAK